MPDYQKRQLAGSVDIGDPGPLPADLQGLADADLANLNWTYEPLGYRGYGFFPVVDPVVPNSITAYQVVRQHMALGNSLEDLQAAIIATADEAFIAYFTKETVYRRDSPFVEQMRVLFSLTEEEMDDFFLAAQAF